MKESRPSIEEPTFHRPLENFVFEGKRQAVTFVETSQVTDGVECDIYKFDGDTEKDLGIIRIKPGKKTPLQKVLQGERTVEGHVSGTGRLTITNSEGQKRVYQFDKATKQASPVTVAIGEQMQWEAAADSDLVAYEICFPPYQDGRFENIS